LPRFKHERSVSAVRANHSYRVSDETLWTASHDGNGEAFGSLYERHAARIYNYLFRRLADWSEAEDLTAVVFMEAFRRRRDAVIVEGTSLPWLYGIATNVIRNRRRAQRRHRDLLEQLAHEGRGNPVPELASRVDAANQMRSTLERISALPRMQQDVVALCLFSGLSYEEASIALGVPVGTVRSRLSRARASLAELKHDARHKEGGVELALERVAENDRDPRRVSAPE
jgi:RNA polymerase sigma factor (sigma-70 family)